jgi:hypothetical protein
MKLRLKQAFLILGLLSWGAPVLADGASFIFTSVPGYANSINNYGQVAGSLGSQGYVDSSGSLSMVNPPYGPLVLSYTSIAINDSDSIVGQAQIVDSSGHIEGTTGFVDTGGTFSRIVGPNGAVVQPFAINDNGQIVGFYNSSGSNTGFVDTAGVFTTVADPNAIGATLPLGINNRGQVVGFFNATGATYGFLDTNGVFQTISDPSGTGTFVTGINDAGELVGYFLTASGVSGFIDIDGVFTTVNAPGAADTFIYGVNDSGEIVGQEESGTGSGSFTAIVSTPEPSGLLLLGIGLLACLGLNSRSRLLRK